ncbi:rhomboid family intramembrane serine protease [Candidatus Woesearchaeota archaeon]|nr:rhomboid family intramembrane serine protease [Candidatus Woesearchaeota archaeon]
MNKILIFAGVLAAVYVSVFLIPESAEKLSLDPDKPSEFWRYISYPFAHLNLKHLIENILGLGLVAFIGMELKTAFSDFSSAYLSSGFFSVLPVWLLMSFTALGASNAIFGGFGLISQETKKYKINGKVIILLLTGLTFMGSILNYLSYGFGEEFMFAFKQGISHFSGLVFGILVFFLLGWAKPILKKKKRYILRGDYR